MSNRFLVTLYSGLQTLGGFCLGLSENKTSKKDALDTRFARKNYEFYDQKCIKPRSDDVEWTNQQVHIYFFMSKYSHQDDKGLEAK